jgi:hypothetical protein
MKMRKLSDDFMDCLQSGFLKDITEMVRKDHDLNLEIRNRFINIYFKGHSLLNLKEVSPSHYKVGIHKAFKKDLDIPPELTNTKTSAIFLDYLPQLKQNIILHGKGSAEIEYEQMIIRANNYEPRSNSEYFIIDRQIVVATGRFDLTGIFWGHVRRRKYQKVSLCLFEVKFSLNSDISKVHNQLTRYYEALKPLAGSFAEECETVFRQKLELGLYDQSSDRLEAMKTLKISRELSDFQFILVLVDYNPNSVQLDLRKLENLPFAKQIKVFHGGLAMWQQNLQPIASENR